MATYIHTHLIIVVLEFANEICKIVREENGTWVWKTRGICSPKLRTNPDITHL